MISDRLWLSPLWVQWLLRAAIFAVFVGGFVLVMYPMSVYRMGWLLTALAVIGLSTVTSGATAYMRRPIRRRYLDALQGLDRPRSLAALEALRTGEVPADPDVLAAAIRTGALAQAYRRGTTRAQRAARWWIPAVAIATAVVEFLATIPLLGEILIGVALLSVIQSVSRARRVRRMRENLQVLRAAADPGPPAPGDDEVAVALPPRRYWQLMAAVTIPVVVFMTLIYVVGR
ncbi:MAG: hypothetical protein WBZ15_17070, partial [Mycobacterium sp.]|uniref:hypothetical protein n=1 Tax=Mycobacterium sp. TaxID=1785 RepID=UPI003C4B1FDE